MSLTDKIKGAWNLATTPYLRMYRDAMKGKYNDMSDEEYLKKMYKLRLGQELNLDNPKKASEKMQWLKIHDRKPIYTTMVDKYDAKKFIADRVGEEYVNPALAVWDNAEDIDITDLPDQFVLKVTHDSGGFVICKDKATFDLEAAKATLAARKNRNFYWGGREWPYKDVKPRILAEPYIDSLGKLESIEYKLTCSYGWCGFFTVCGGPAHQELWKRSNDTFDRDFNLQPWYVYYPKSANPPTEKPKYWDKMIEIAEVLSKDIPHLRVDFYVHDDHIYVGEMTFFTWSGFLKFNLPEWDEKLGEMIKLPEV